MSEKLPTGELVAIAYGRWALARYAAMAPVVTTLPEPDSWSATGAVQVEGIVGSTWHETNLRDMVVSYGGWATRPGSDRPPYGQANGLLEFIRDTAFLDWWSIAPDLDLMPIGVYLPVRVQSVHPLTEPRRIPDQDTSRAHYTMDVRIIWTTR